MPIKGLTNQAPQFPCVGELRKGSQQSGGNMGKDLTYFRFTSDIPEVMESFESAYDGEPRLINVFLPFRYVDDNWEAWQEEWVASGLRHRCDGEHGCDQRQWCGGRDGHVEVYGERSRRRDRPGYAAVKRCSRSGDGR